MRFLLDTSSANLGQRSKHQLVLGQLLTPLTRYRPWNGPIAVDNGAFTGLDVGGYRRLIDLVSNRLSDLLFVAVPDIVGNARRTLELFHRKELWLKGGMPAALVLQDGVENTDIPWDDLRAVFVGGKDPWKDSSDVIDLVKTAKILEKHVHVGRVNSPSRFKRFHEAGADTCDGSGVVKYDHMLEAISRAMSEPDHPRLFSDQLMEDAGKKPA